jgi:hypothetical protein
MCGRRTRGSGAALCGSIWRIRLITARPGRQHRRYTALTAEVPSCCKIENTGNANYLSLWRLSSQACSEVMSMPRLAISIDLVHYISYMAQSHNPANFRIPTLRNVLPSASTPASILIGCPSPVARSTATFASESTGVWYCGATALITG